MSIQSQVDRLDSAIAAAFASCSGRSATMPTQQVIENLPECIESIPAGITPTGSKEITANGEYDVTEFAKAVVSIKDTEHFAYGYKTMTANESFEVTGIVDQQGNAFTPKGYAFMIASDISGNTNITNSTNGLIYCFYDTVNSIMRRTITNSSANSIRENPGVSSGSVGSGFFKQAASSDVIYNVMGRRYFWVAWG